MDVRTNQNIVWDAVPGAVDYQAELSQLSGVVDRVLVVTATQVAVADLFAGIALGQTRRVRVRARDGFGDGAWTSYLSPLVLVGLPAPANLRVE